MKRADAYALYDELNTSRFGDWKLYGPRCTQNDDQTNYFLTLASDHYRHDIAPIPPLRLLTTLTEHNITPTHRIINPNNDDLIYEDEYPRGPPYVDHTHHQLIIDNNEHDVLPERAEELRRERLEADLRDALDLPDNDYPALAAAYTTVAEVLTADNLDDHISPEATTNIHERRSPALTEALETNNTPRLITQNEHGTYDPAYDLHSTPDIEADLQHKAELDNAHL